MPYLLAIDEGTSSTRAMIYTPQGKLVHSSQQTLKQYYPQAGWVEQDPEEIWESTLSAIREVISRVNSMDILACGITNQRETTLIWDKQTGACLAPAISWQDRRTTAFCTSLTQEAALIREKTGLPPDSYFSASKIHWLMNHIPLAKQLAEQGRLAFGSIDSFLIWRLTGKTAHVTDVTNAARTLLFNIHKQCWDDELLTLFSVPKNILPTVCDSDGHFGVTSHEVLGIKIPITGVAGDQQAALIGQRCFSEGMVKATFGTGGFLLLNTGYKPVVSKQLLTTIAYRIRGKTCYGLEGGFYQAGTTVKWLRDVLGLIKNASDTEQLARGLNNNEGVYLVPSFTGLGAPHWISTYGGAIIGLSQTSSAAHFARAALESVCYQTRDILTCMIENSGIPLVFLRVDGGMAANQWLLQFLASLCTITVQQPSTIETTALGAALLAAIGCGMADSLENLQKNWEAEKEFKPDEKYIVMDAYYEGWLHALSMIKAGERNY